MLKVQPRLESSKMMAWCSPFIAVALTLAVSSMMFLWLNVDPVKAFQVFVIIRITSYNVCYTKLLRLNSEVIKPYGTTNTTRIKAHHPSELTPIDAEAVKVSTTNTAHKLNNANGVTPIFLFV